MRACCITLQFIIFGKFLCEQLRARGYWADYRMECLLNYKAYNAGFCKILTHPKWGSAVYPATIFTHAPVDVVKSLIESLPSGEAA